MFQSTHPYRVRLVFSIYSVLPSLSFNPRTHTGCDLQSTLLLHLYYGFNPRTHTGCDKIVYFKTTAWKGFNPRTHTGCDFTIIRICRSNGVSIHAPIQGATVEDNINIEKVVFQSTHPYRVRLANRWVDSTYITSFNPRTHTGCDNLMLMSK